MGKRKRAKLRGELAMVNLSKRDRITGGEAGMGEVKGSR